MKLLVETALSDTFNVLEEAEGKSLHIEGIFMQTNIRNINGRIYPKETVRGEVERYIKEVVNNNRALGELNHPKDPTLNPERACIKIVSLKESGDNYIGKAKVLQHTPMGAIVAGLLRDGVQLGVSSRALGSVRKDHTGTDIVQKDFRLISAADVVLEPSAPDAFVTALIESREWVYQNGVLVEATDDMKDTINKQYKAGFSNQQSLALFEDLVRLIGEKVCH